MIIICACGKKKFNIDENLIPDKGRNIKCGACDHIWFYKKPVKNLDIKDEDETNIILKNDEFSQKKEIKKSSENLRSEIDKIVNKKDKALVKYKKKNHFTLSKFLSYIIVTIVSFIGLVLILDTFKFQLYILFPSLEILLFSLFETLKDINLFIKDLI